MADISKLEQQEERIHKKIAELWSKKLKEECPEFTSLEDVFNSLSTANQLKRMSVQMRGDTGEQATTFRYCPKCGAKMNLSELPTD